MEGFVRVIVFILESLVLIIGGVFIVIEGVWVWGISSLVVNGVRVNEEGREIIIFEVVLSGEETERFRTVLDVVGKVIGIIRLLIFVLK